MQRKATKNTRGPNADEKRFQGWLKERPCTVNGFDPVVVHHCEGATFKHNKVLIGHWFCIPLCEEVDEMITQGSRRKFRNLFGAQSDHWQKQIRAYESETGRQCPQDVYDAITDWNK